MSVFWEVVLALVALVASMGLLRVSARSIRYGKVEGRRELVNFRPIRAYLCALFAWAPAWLALRLFWLTLGPDHSAGFGMSGWFWIVFWVSVLATLASAVPFVSLFMPVLFGGVLMVLLIAIDTPWFGGDWMTHHKFLWLYVIVTAAVFLAALVVASASIAATGVVGVLMLALVLYLGVHWDLWLIFDVLFWFAVAVAAVGFVFWRYGLGMKLARIGSFVALAITLILVFVAGAGAVFNQQVAFNPDFGDHETTSAKPGSPVVDDVNKDAPKAQFSVTHMDGRKVTFDASNSDTHTTHDVTYVWDFGDNTDCKAHPDKCNSGSAVITHTYPTTGTYPVHVTATNTTTKADDTSKSVNVRVTKLHVVVKTKGVVVKGGSITKVYHHFKAGQLHVGNGQIPNSPRESAASAFSTKSIKNRQMLDATLHSGNPLAVKAVSHAKRAMKQAGYTQTDINRCFDSSKYWIYVAPTVASQISGTTYPINGKVVKVMGFRGVKANDAMWYCVGRDHNLIRESAIRADCSNPGVAKITPIPAGEIPPSIACMHHCKTRHVHNRPPEHGGPPSRHHVCPVPPGVPSMYWDSARCQKKPSSFDYQQNHSPAHQPVQENHNHVYTGPTKGTSGAPKNTGTHANDPNPTTSGSNSGSNTGSGTPTGGGSDGSGGTAPTNDPDDTGQGGTGNGGTTTEGGVIVNPG